MSNVAVGRRIASRRVLDFGPATISGVVRELTVPVSRPVYLLDQAGFRCVQETRSASNGTYSFQNVPEGQQYIVMSIDPNGAYNAVVADRVQT